MKFTYILIALLLITTIAFATVEDGNYGFGKDGSLYFSTTTKTYGNLTTPADYSVSGNTLYLKSDRLYDFTNFYLGVGTILSTTDTNGVVIYIRVNHDANIYGDINLQGIITTGYNGKTVTLDGNTFTRISGGAGGNGGRGASVTNEGEGVGGTGGTGSASGFGAGGGGGSAARTSGTVCGGNGGLGTDGGPTAGSGGGAVTKGSSGCVKGQNATNYSAGGGPGFAVQGTSDPVSGSGANAYSKNGNFASPNFSATGGGGGSGGQPGNPPYQLVIKARNLNKTGNIYGAGYSGTNGGNGANGYTSQSYMSAGGGGGGGGGGGANGSKLYFIYYNLDANTGTNTITAGTKGTGGTKGDNELGSGSVTLEALNGSDGTNGTTGALYFTNSTPWDTTPPTTIFTATQYTNEIKSKLSFVCTDNNSGCTYLHYNINSTTWTQVANTGTYDLNYSSSGFHTIQYFSTDNSDNNETIKTSNFTTYGNIRFNIYDENTGTALKGVTINDGTTDYSTGANYYYDFNLQGTTTQTKTYTISKTGYSTRTYTLDQNQFLDLNINFALLPTELSQEINFKFFKPDEITAYANIYIETKKGTLTLGRQKSNTLGEIKINLDQNATGITFDMNNGENTYQAVLLTINRPKSETTLIDIPENWGYEISGLASYIDSNVSTNTKVFAIYSNTVRSYSIQISSASITPKYAPRKYDVQIIGDQNTYTLQPYLIDNEVSVTTTLYTINAYTNQAISDVTIKIYRNLPVTGRTLIEQTITDAKGQSIVYLILNQTYSFEISIGETIIRTETYTITATSSGIWFKIDPGYVFETKPALNNVLAYWTPGKNWLGESDANISTKIEYQTAVSNTRTVSSVRITCDNDGGELFQDNFSNPTVPFTQTYDFNLITKTINSVNFDGNYPITCLTRITLNDGNVIEATQTYVVRNDSPQQNLGFNLRPVFGCTATNDPNIPCPSMIFFALLATMMLTAGIMIESGFTQPEFAGILFFVGLGFFTFFTWIPPFLYVVALVIALLVYVALGVRRI
jgi:hypothetical protein